MKKELPHYSVGLSYGGNQEWFDGISMKMGGCAAETACESCIYLDKYKGTKLYPFDPCNINKSDYRRFGSIMKPYLHPRFSGVDRLSIFIDGFGAYLKERGSDITLTGFEGTEEYESAKAALIAQIESGMPVPYLCLNHSNRRYHDYEWHWFLINGYDCDGAAFRVKAVTYGNYEWLNFEELWNTGRARKGGFIIISEPVSP